MKPFNRKSIWRRSLLLFVGALFATVEARAQNAVVDWNKTAVSTIIKTVNSGGVTPTAGMTGIYLAYVNLTIFDTLNAIHPGFQPYGGIQPYAAADSSEAAAVATAAHDVLVNYFPAASVSLDAPTQITSAIYMTVPRPKMTA
jgi:hypothetical protein